MKKPFASSILWMVSMSFCWQAGVDEPAPPSAGAGGPEEGRVASRAGALHPN